MDLRKGVIFSIKISYRSARAHPYISCILFFFLILCKIFPILFTFLVSSSPVILCTAILIATLISYGTPQIPESEGKDQKSREISSLQIPSVVDDIIVEKDENLVDGKKIKEAISELSNRACNVQEICCVATNDENVRESKTVSDTGVDSSLKSHWHQLLPVLDELELENKDANKESEENDETNERKPVMDLGYSEIERNRRLENLIAKRRLKKLQRFETEKNLVDLDSYHYSSSISFVSAPRPSPFDIITYDSDANLNLPPIPGSAPSIMQPRKNPFDICYDLVEEMSSLSREYLNHHDFHISKLTSKDAGAFGAIKKEIEEVEDNLYVPDAGKVESIEEMHEGSNSFPSLVEANKNFLCVGSENFISNSLTSDAQTDLSEAASRSNQIKANLSIEDQNRLHMKSEHDIGSNNDLIDSQRVNTDELIIRQHTGKFGEAEDSLYVSDIGNVEIIKEMHEGSNSSTFEEEKKFLYEGTENLGSDSLSSDVEARSSEAAWPLKQIEENPLLEDQNLSADGNERDPSLELDELNKTVEDSCTDRREFKDSGILPVKDADIDLEVTSEAK